MDSKMYFIISKFLLLLALAHGKGLYVSTSTTTGPPYSYPYTYDFSTLGSFAAASQTCDNPSHSVLLAIGGDSDGETIASVELYDPAADSWRPVAPLPVAKQEFGTAVNSNKIYVCGGKNIDSELNSESMLTECLLYDPISNKWNVTAVAPMQVRRSRFAMAELDGYLYAVGGNESPQSAERYDPATNAWTILPDCPGNMIASAATSFGSKLYVAGGNNATTTFKHLFSFDPNTEVWEQLADMPTARGELALVALPTRGGNGKLFALGGWDVSEYTQSKVESYDIATNSWTKMRHGLVLKRAALAAAVINRNIYVVGGLAGQEYVARGRRYRISTDGNWSLLTDIRLRRGNLNEIALMATQRKFFGLAKVNVC